MSKENDVTEFMKWADEVWETCEEEDDFKNDYDALINNLFVLSE